MWASQHSRFVKGPVTERFQRLSSREYFSRFAEVFHGFVDENLPLTRRYTSIDELRENPPSADVYVCGSDQVWNTDYNVGGTEPYLLAFGPGDVPRISLSSSIGKRPFSQADAALFTRTLSEFAWLSVREDSARDDLAAIGIEAEVIPDPTLLLPPDDWRSLPHGAKSEHGFVLVYALNRGTGVRSAAKKVARELDLPLVTLNPRPLPWVHHRHEFRVPPVPKFLELLATASHVVTDSFHATAFSLNLGTPLTVSMPPKYSSRLRGVLQMTGTEARDLRHTDYSPDMSTEMSVHAQDVLRSRRERAVARLRDVLDNLVERGPQ
jgi:polysaccharide pyruvyl transferase WcaK-like protein